MPSGWVVEVSNDDGLTYGQRAAAASVKADGRGIVFWRPDSKPNFRACTVATPYLETAVVSHVNVIREVFAALLDKAHADGRSSVLVQTNVVQRAASCDGWAEVRCGHRPRRRARPVGDRGRAVGGRVRQGVRPRQRHGERPARAGRQGLWRGGNDAPGAAGRPHRPDRCRHVRRIARRPAPGRANRIPCRSCGSNRQPRGRRAAVDHEEPAADSRPGVSCRPAPDRRHREAVRRAGGAVLGPVKHLLGFVGKRRLGSRLRD